MLDMGIVRHSESPYSSPIVTVKKKDGSIRVCIDFRKLNNLTVFDAEPIPNQDELMIQLSRAKFATRVDLAKGYWQIPLQEECKEFTAFQSPLGLLEFNYMPFGLSTAASTFQRMMRIMLKDIDNAISYFDDIMIYSETWPEHLAAITDVLNKLRQNGLTARPSKTQIGEKEIEFLGHIIGNGQQRPEKSKIDKIHDLKPPSTKKEVRKVLGLLNYYRKFVPSFADIAKPLTDLTKQGMPNRVIWTTECQTSFELIKNALTKEPILALPQIDKEFVIRTDASDFGIGGVLMQENNGNLQPCAYVSRKLLDREKKYAIIEKECLAMIFAVSKFQKYLLLRQFTIETDHKPLSFIKSNKAKNSRLMRWALTLQQFSFNVKPISGNANLEADILSRLL